MVDCRLKLLEALECFKKKNWSYPYNIVVYR